jgi:heme o synthase
MGGSRFAVDGARAGDRVVTTAEAISRRPTLARRLSACLELTKPNIMLLVLVTGVPALMLAGGSALDPRVAVAAVAGIALASASAAAFNHYFDRDIDARMRRTAARPLPSGILRPEHALIVGFGLGALSMVVLAAGTTLLAAAIALASIIYYAVFYTIWLKRRTPHNTVIGGAAGSSAPIIAWAAATGTVSPTAALMAAIVFLWTPPHFWALSLYRREDYLRANLPMLPVTHGEEETRRQIVIYTWLLFATTLGLAVLVRGPVYAFAAVVLGVRFLRDVHRLRATAATPDAIRVFRFSILYLFVLYAALTADAAIRLIRGS